MPSCFCTQYNTIQWFNTILKVLGTPVEAIMATEDRDVFNQKLAGKRIDGGPGAALCRPSL